MNNTFQIAGKEYYTLTEQFCKLPRLLDVYWELNKYYSLHIDAKFSMKLKLHDVPPSDLFPYASFP